MPGATSFGTAISSGPAVLGKNVTVIGEIRSHEPLTIEGEVEGTIDATGHLLTIAPSGNVRADVQAKEIDVLGSLEGNIDQADVTHIRAGAREKDSSRSDALPRAIDRATTPCRARWNNSAP